MGIIENFLVWSRELSTAFGYVGIFMVSILGTSSILFPLPLDILIFTVSAFFNPWILGIVSGVGSSIGEMTSYFVAFAGAKIVEMTDKKHKSYEKAVRYFDKYGFWIIPVFAFTPLPMDVVGLAAGGMKYDYRRFFLGVLIGKIPRMLIISLAGYYGIGWIMSYLST